jgi:hypothetical protein
LQRQYFDAGKIAALRAAQAAAAEQARANAESAARAERLALDAEQALAARRAADAAAERAGAERTATMMQILRWALAAVLAFCIYFAPAFIGRHKVNADAIAVLNIFLGWTLVGWVVALTWAMTKDAPAAVR